MLERGSLADHPTERHPDDVGGGNPVTVEHPDDVVNSIIESISRPTWRVLVSR
ncbi:hypothetical protein ACVI1N_005162 [Sinorhizobium medicae]